MKGSPAKLGSIEGTTGHASALKMASSPAKIGGIGGMIVNKVMKKAGKKLGKIMPKKGAAPAPTKFCATVAKVAIGANKKRNAQKQARDDAKNKGVQDAMSKGPSKF